MKKERLVYIITIILSALYIFFGNKAANVNKIDYSSGNPGGTPIKVQVTKVVNPDYADVIYPDFVTEDRVILFEARILSGYRNCHSHTVH